jgi:TonB family protein
MKGLRKAALYVLTVAAAAAITYALFILIPLLHALFGFDLEQAGSAKQRALIQVERIPPKKKEENKEVRHFRPVATSQPKTGGNAGSGFAMRFTPDLSVDAGASDGPGVALQNQELQAEVFEEGQTDEDAAPVYQPPIPYPERARELGVQGTLEAIYVVDHQGKVVSTDIVKTPGPVFTAEARKVMATWRFKPARNKGVPVNQRRKLIIDFTLE